MSNNEIAEGFNMTELGPLPEGWAVARLDDVIDKTKQKDPRKTPDQRFKYIDVSSISREALKIAEYKLYQGKDAPSRAKKLVKNKDVIFATVRPTLKRLTLIDGEFDGKICSTAFCVLRARENTLSPPYMFYAIQRDVFINELGKIQRGASYPAVTDSDVKNQKIPLPPLPEQHRIAAVLSAVQDAKEKTGAVIAAAKSLKKSLMRHLFTYGPVPAGAAESAVLMETEIGLVPEGWEVVRLGDVSDFKNGINFTKDQKGKSGILTIDVFNMYSEGIHANLKSLYRVDKRIKENYLLRNGDILFVRSSLKREGVGWASLFRETQEPVTFCGFIIRARMKSNEIYPEFLTNYLRTATAREDLIASSGKVAITNINQGMLGKIPIPIPPLSTQQKIVTTLSTVDKKIEAEENKKKALDELFKSLLHNLMTGKIRVNHLEAIP
ncbi:MAG: hypothetical protein GQ567_00590 [Methanosarcinales archaeon]|nr:hypothetical protein [Methanosarcinales archaeon]